MKKSSSRSQRGSKGIKGKHVLQICVLLGVCIWLIYQVKYSHDKKKEFYEKDGEKSTVLLSEREDGLVKLGRKDLLPGYHNNKNENEKEKQVEEEEDEEDEKEGKSKVEEEKEEEEEVVEEDEEDKNKQGEEVAEDDEDESKHEEDEIDEQDQSKSEGDNDKEDELLEEEKESDEKEKESSHVDEIDMTVHEAREEHYKADDASSAVSHESRVLSTEKLKDSPENSTEVAQEKNSNATTSKVEMQKELGLKLGEVVSGYVVKNATTEVKDGDSQSSDSDTRNAVTEARGETVSGNSTEAILEASGFLQNETEIMRDRSREDGAPPVGFSNLQTVFNLEQIHNQSNSNITVPANVTGKDSIQDESRNSTSESSLTGNISASNSTDAKDNSTSESSLIENISASNTTEEKESSRSEGDDESAEKESSNLNSTDQTEEADDTPERSITEEETEADDTRERSISDEEREALIDPQTLPDIRVEGNEEDEDEAIGAE